MVNCFLSLFVSVEVSDAYVNVLCIIVFFLYILVFYMFLFLKKFCSIKCALLTFLFSSVSVFGDCYLHQPFNAERLIKTSRSEPFKNQNPQ
jgi:4-hydroxybenzoate polyprenyltransferase